MPGSIRTDVSSRISQRMNSRTGPSDQEEDPESGVHRARSVRWLRGASVQVDPIGFWHAGVVRRCPAIRPPSAGRRRPSSANRPASASRSCRHRATVLVESEVRSKRRRLPRQDSQHREREDRLRQAAEPVEQRSVHTERERQGPSDDEQPAERDHGDADTAVQIGGIRRCGSGCRAATRPASRRRRTATSAAPGRIAPGRSYPAAASPSAA